MSATTLITNGETFHHTSFSGLNAQSGYNSYFESATGMEALILSDSDISNADILDPGEPFLEITMQPCDKFRFRYKSESGSHGKLRGPLKNRSKTNFPTVKLHNRCESNDNIEIKATLYTEGKNPHILELVGKNCTNGSCTEKLSDDNTAIFRFLEIESKRKEEVINILTKKKIELCDNYNEEEIRKQAQEEMKLLNMNCAVLCFEAFCNNIPICEKVFSDPIKNLKATCSDLRITRISSCSGSCKGGEDIILLCDKINKDDIEIHFCEKNESDEILWEGKGDFNPKVDVHHQVAIAFKTPAYDNIITGRTEVQVLLELFRPSDQQRSESRMYTYILDDYDVLRHSKKRKLNPAESVELQNINQASCSSELTSSLSNSSGDEVIAAFQGSSNTPLSGENFLFQIFGDNFENLLPDSGDDDCSQILVDNPLMSSTADINNPLMSSIAGNNDLWMSCTTDNNDLLISSTADKYDHDVQMEAPYFKELLQDGYEESCIEYNSAKRQLPIKKDNNCIIKETPTSSGTSFSSLWDDTVGRLLSYMDLSNYKITAACGQSDLFPVGQMADSVTKDSQSAKFSSGSVFNHFKSLSIQEKIKTDFKPSVPEAVSNIKSQTKTVCTDKNLYDVGSTWNKKDKTSEISKNFSNFKKGVSQIMKKRNKDVYLHYISRLVSVEDENGNLFLHLAVMEQTKNLNLIARILKIEPEIVNKKNKFQETALHLATQNNAWKVVFLLLANGGNPSIVDVNGNNCFHIASKSNYAKTMGIMLLPSLKHGKTLPCLDVLNYDGFAPLHLSVLNNAKECMKLLLQAGADVNVNDRRSGSSPLHLAIKEESSLASDLLSHPDIDLSNTDFSDCSIVEALSVMKGIPVPEIGEFADLVHWARKSVFLPSKDDGESSSAGSSSSCDSYEEEEIHNSNETVYSHCMDYSRSYQPRITGIAENLNPLNKALEEKLCKCLDSEGGWRKLGVFLDLDEKTMNGVAKLSKNSSPSKLILNRVKKCYENCDKQTLINILSVADLQQAASILQE